MTGSPDRPAPRGHAEETINAVIGDLELARNAITQEAPTAQTAIAAKLKALAGELTELAGLLDADHS